MSWRAGDKAYCVETFHTFSPFQMPNGTPQRGVTYLVDGITACNQGTGSTGLYLCGLPMTNAGGGLAGYCSQKFRKVVPRSDRELMEAKDAIDGFLGVKGRELFGEERRKAHEGYDNE